ncbi:Putative Peroxin domain-containing protein [Septoria linicola]|uniref:Peroxin domain-containing protein n=1 Tax=Septoria linicola TaxID=215465 RepID=A0A9Q9AK23_9PEZI|nr:putative Peroxin domain-containing protein [Septoria linicola]USW47517.1 Putative Peroxin domain-containing protein [Septoria linicola]
MANEVASPLANRDEPIPVIRISSNEDDYDSDTSEVESEVTARRRDRLRDRASRSTSRLREKLEGGSDGGRQSLQDRLFASVLSQIIPSEGAPASTLDDDDDEDNDAATGQPARKKKDRRSKKYVDKPEFGPRLMTYNFRRFNARIGVVFVFENMLIRLFSWRQATSTLSFMAIYSLVCLKPHLLPLIPLGLLLFGIMIPSFLARHPTPANDPRIEPSYRGAATAPASRVKPAPDFSTDFWRNMRDLQNSMEDFSRLHDAANQYVTPYTNFSDEAMSSGVFLVLTVLSLAAFVGSGLVPWRAIALLGGWAAVLSGHPQAQKILLSTRNMKQLKQHVQLLQSTLRSWVEQDIVMDEPAELRQVEVFELQKNHNETDTWESWLFSPSPHDPLSPARIAGSRPKGTQFFEEVQAPLGWEFKEKKWTLDLFSREWVEERMISGVEIETAGERWVYDLPAEEVELLDSLGSPSKGKSKQRVKSIPKSGWEEGTGLERRGDWRRRRWTRLVTKKKAVDDTQKT